MRRETLGRHKDGTTFPVEVSVGAAQDGLQRVLVGIVRDIRDRKRSEEHIRHLANHDSLTGLPNRRLFADRLEHALAQARRDGKRLALMLIDLDRFKEVNDTLGHAVGDHLLAGVGERLRARLRASDTLARLGGDEFAVIQTDLADPEGAEVLARQLQQALEAPFTLAGQDIDTAATIGITIFPDDGERAERLLQNADLALYRAKGENRGWVQFFLPALNIAALARRRREQELRQALQGDCLVVAYQPMVDLASGGIVALEALLRWRHPRRGLVGPDAFPGVAEGAGLMGEIGRRALEAACARAAADAPDGPAVAVNIAASQLRRGNLPRVVDDLLRRHRLPPDRLELEISERVELETDGREVEALHALVELGITLSLDDFGTGSASLSRLRRLPFHKLKIDPSLLEVGIDPLLAEAVAGLGRWPGWGGGWASRCAPRASSAPSSCASQSGSAASGSRDPSCRGRCRPGRLISRRWSLGSGRSCGGRGHSSSTKRPEKGRRGSGVASRARDAGAALDAILDVALPFFGIIFAGYAAVRLRLLGRDGIRGLNDFVFHFALPALLFLNVALAPFEQLVAPRLLAAYYLATASIGVLGALVGRALGGPAHRGIAGLRAISGVFGNIGYMGIPLVLTAFGREAGIIAVLILTADNVIQLTLAIVLLEAATGGGTLRRTLTTVAAGLVRNPMIQAIVAGIVCAALQVPLPGPLVGFAELLGAAAAPCALFALGGTLVSVPLAAVDAEVVALTLLKILVHPAAVLLAVTQLMPLPVESGWIVFVISAMPTGANVFVLAQRYDTWIAPASTVVLLTHIGSVATVSAVLAVPA